MRADAPANASFSATSGDLIKDHDFGTFRQGAAGATFNFSVFNVPAPTGTTSPMTLSNVGSFGNTVDMSLQTGTVAGLTAGSQTGMQLILTTTHSGRLAVSYTLDFSSDTVPQAPLARLALAGHAIITPPGDYDSDGDVDSTDYGIWKSHYGSNFVAADGNQNGVVDTGDYVIWRKYYTGPLGSGNSSLGNSTLSAPVAVPEPAAGALVLLTANFLGLSMRLRWRCRERLWRAAVPIVSFE